MTAAKMRSILLALSLFLPLTALAQPTGDSGILAGRCNTAAVPGKQLGGGSAGAVLIGDLRAPSAYSPAGRSIDKIDRGCIGEMLELAPNHLTVRWINASHQAAYAVTPMRAASRHGMPCRVFSGQITLAGRTHLLHGTACRAGEGYWAIA